MKNVHILPTTPNDETAKGFWIEKTRDWCNIYITSDEEIKEGDFVIEDIGGVVYGSIDRESIVENPKKIILTTDQELIADGVQAIDDDFLQWFVKNPSCMFIEVESFVNGNVERIYEIIIPSEECKVYTEGEYIVFEFQKQELPKLGTKEFNDLASAYFGGKPRQETLQGGAKCKAERMYSEEEVLAFGKSCFYKGFEKSEKDDANCYTAFREEIGSLFEQFEKK
jgi:hypothetical protein